MDPWAPGGAGEFATFLSHGDDDMPARVGRAHGCGEPRAIFVIDVDHRRAAGEQQGGEQPRLGGEIAVHIRMVIEMVAAEIGEGGNMYVQPVKTVLRKAVATCLDCQMRHAGPGQRLQRAVQADGVGCR